MDEGSVAKFSYKSELSLNVNCAITKVETFDLYQSENEYVVLPFTGTLLKYHSAEPPSPAVPYFAIETWAAAASSWPVTG